MQFFSRVLISLSRFFGSGKLTEVVYFFVFANRGHPFLGSLNKTNSFDAAFVVGVYFMITLILRTCGIPQIIPAIVVLIGVLMVYFKFRPLARHVEPCESVSKITFVFDANANPVKLHTACNSSYESVRGEHFTPFEYSGSAVIVQNAANIFRSQISMRVSVTSFHGHYFLGGSGGKSKGCPIKAPNGLPAFLRRFSSHHMRLSTILRTTSDTSMPRMAARALSHAVSGSWNATLRRVFMNTQLAAMRV